MLSAGACLWATPRGPADFAAVPTASQLEIPFRSRKPAKEDPMSTQQDNPFKRNDDTMFSEQAPRKSGKRTLLIGCGIFGLLGMLVCCGGVAYFAYQGPKLMAQAVNAAMAVQLQQQLAADPNVQQKIGTIESLEFDFTRMIEEAQKPGAGGEPRMAFRIKGTNGQGYVMVVQDPSSPNGVGIKSGTLIMDDGTEFPLDMSAVRSAPPSTLEINMDDVITEGQPDQQ
jgi:hypothetical protein